MNFFLYILCLAFMLRRGMIMMNSLGYDIYPKRVHIAMLGCSLFYCSALGWLSIFSTGIVSWFSLSFCIFSIIDVRRDLFAWRIVKKISFHDILRTRITLLGDRVLEQQYLELLSYREISELTIEQVEKDRECFLSGEMFYFYNRNKIKYIGDSRNKKVKREYEHSK